MKSPAAQCLTWLCKTGGKPAQTVRALRFGAVAALLLMFMTGCSSFNREWKKVSQQPTPANSIEGRWEGKWVSDADGHSGKLRCLLTRDETQYHARFRATYRKILHFSYTVPLKVEQRDGQWHFTGEEDLGKMAGGIYRYEGNATPTKFHSTYKSKYDHGTFEMQRPE